MLTCIPHIPCTVCWHVLNNIMSTYFLCYYQVLWLNHVIIWRVCDILQPDIPSKPSDRSPGSSKRSEESIKSMVDVGDGGESDLASINQKSSLSSSPKHPTNSSSSSALLESSTAAIQTPSSSSAILEDSPLVFSLFSALFPHGPWPSFSPPFSQQSTFTCSFLWQLKHSMLLINPFQPFHGFLDPLSAWNATSLSLSFNWQVSQCDCKRIRQNSHWYNYAKRQVYWKSDFQYSELYTWWLWEIR